MSKLGRLVPGPGNGRLGWQALAVLAYALELLFFTFWRAKLGPYASPLCFYGSGVLLVVAALACLRDQPYQPELAPRVVRRLGWGFAIAVGGALLVLRKQVPIVLSQPLDASVSDIIPLIQVYVDRFMAGEVVYRYLTILPYPVFPNYLPTQWLPYVLARELGIDFRWVSTGLLLVVGLGAYHLVLLRRPLKAWCYVLLAVLPAYVLLLLLRTEWLIYAHTLEPTIITYYFLLAASLFTRSAWLRAGALALCLLGRYSVVFWVPYFLWLLWREAGPRHAVLVAALLLAATLGIYVVPFLSHDWTIFTHALAEYRLAALGEWGRSELNNGLPVHLGNGLGFAPWVYWLLESHSLVAKVAWMQRLHAVASAGVVGLIAAFTWRYGRRFDYRYLAVVTLKLYLATFYFFLQVPYPYLTSLSVLMSLFVLMLTLLTNQRRPAAAPVPAAE